MWSADAYEEGLPPARQLGSGGGDKDNPEGPNVEVTLTGGIASVGAQRATLTSDGGRVHAFNAGIGFFAKLQLTGTLSECKVDHIRAGLDAYLNFDIDIDGREQTNQAGEIAISFQFHVQRKKGSGGFFVIWRYPDDGGTDSGKGIRVQVSSANVGEED